MIEGPPFGHAAGVARGAAAIIPSRNNVQAFCQTFLSDFPQFAELVRIAKVFHAQAASDAF
jgi:hypothetical protein